MDEKTEELRDIFMSVSDDAEVTERQAETPGSLVNDENVDERLAAVVATMRENVGFETTLGDDALVSVVRGFYEGATDAEIASDLGETVQEETVARARLDLHLLRDRDEDVPVSLDALRDLLDSGASVADAAAELDVSESTIRRSRRVLETKAEIRRVSDRYRDDFEDILEDRGLAERMTRSAQESGLDGSLEGQETDTQL